MKRVQRYEKEAEGMQPAWRVQLMCGRLQKKAGGFGPLGMRTCFFGWRKDRCKQPVTKRVRGDVNVQGRKEGQGGSQEK
eukprot:1161653-Pelagomonas_calceolata.AAC.7